jgi:hypothetical protein
MTAPAFALQDTISFSELKALASAPGPCITIGTSLPNPLEIRTRLKNAVHGIQKHLQTNEDHQSATALLDPVQEAARTMEAGNVWGKALLLLRSAKVFQGYWLRECRNEILQVGDHFNLRPLLAAVAREQRFHLLAISRKHVRLFHCTMFQAEEDKLHASFPANMQDWMNARQPDHVLENRSAGGPSTGSMKGVMFGTSTGREKGGEYVKHFFKEVDRGVHAVLRDDPSPLVLAGVEEELAVYRSGNTWPNLFPEEVHGSPDGLTTQDLVGQARSLLSRAPSAPLRKVFAELERHPVSWDEKEIPGMAREGRIEDLLIPEDAEDERLDRAALETLRHGGRVFAIASAEMPRRVPAMAALRH